MSFPEATTYHDEIAVDGQTAEAEDVNKPARQLDAALGVVATRVAVGINTDGTFKSNVVGTANIAASAVTTAKIADAAVTYAKLGVAEQLKLMGRRGFHPTSAVTYDATWPNLMATAVGVWDDGSIGAYTSTVNATWGAIDGWQITHTTSGKTLTQPSVTRDSQGRETVRPSLTVTP